MIVSSHFSNSLRSLLTLTSASSYLSNLRFAKQITVLEPTLYNVAKYYFEKDSAKILGLRIDTLSQMANLANLGPGGRFLIVDTTGGMLVAAALDRLGGKESLYLLRILRYSSESNIMT
jgi:tRNA (adenine-N(1)-)-methyltransferase non-catalytic subunit